MNRKNTDRITEKVLLRAPRARVWHALADSGEFGQWFGVKGLGAFTPGAGRHPPGFQPGGRLYLKMW